MECRQQGVEADRLATSSGTDLFDLPSIPLDKPKLSQVETHNWGGAKWRTSMGRERLNLALARSKRLETWIDMTKLVEMYTAVTRSEKAIAQVEERFGSFAPRAQWPRNGGEAPSKKSRKAKGKAPSKSTSVEQPVTTTPVPQPPPQPVVQRPSQAKRGVSARLPHLAPTLDRCYLRLSVRHAPLSRATTRLRYKEVPR